MRAKLATRVYSPLCVAAILVATALALPASASATFTEISPFTGTFGCPGPLAFDPGGGGGGRVYVEDNCPPADSGQPQIDAYTADGSGLITGFGTDGVLDCFTYEGSPECFDSLGGASVDSATSELYVADQNASLLFDFDDSGDDLAQSAARTFVQPQGLAIYNDDVYAAGGGAVRYTALGFGPSVLQASLAASDPSPIAIAIDPNTGATFVLDEDNKLVDEYNSSGLFVGVFATGFGSGTFSDPVAIALDPVAHVVYVADEGTGTVDTFDESTGASLLQVPVRSGDSPSGIALDPTNRVLYVAYTDTGNSALVDRFSYSPPPACNAVTGATKGGIATSLALSCMDTAAPAVTYAIAANPGNGTLSGFNPATGAVTYTPNAGFTGTDTFTYTGGSVDGRSDPTTVTVTVTGPTCASQTLSTGYEAALAVTLVCSDTTAPVASYEIVTPPVDGVLSTPSASGALTYTPNALFHGTDSFTFEAVSANDQTSAPTTVTIFVGITLPPPSQGVDANVYFSSGTVTILLPGQTTPIPLVSGVQAPLGSIIQTTDGQAGVFVEIDGVLQGADFFDGQFKLTQSPDPHTILDLLGRKIPKLKCTVHTKSFSGTFSRLFKGSRQDGATATIAKAIHEKGKPVRQLWGSGHGNFTTVGNGSSASVRGTEWAIFDYPDGTLTEDFTDSVSVDDFHRHKTIVITAGHYYFAALGNLPACKKASKAHR